MGTEADGEKHRPERRNSRSEKQPGGERRVTLVDLIKLGILVPPLKLFRKYRGQLIEAELLPTGTVAYKGQQYPSCSTAGGLARESITGKPMHTNGWTFWQYRDGEGRKQTLNDARHAYLAKQNS